MLNRYGLTGLLFLVAMALSPTSAQAQMFFEADWVFLTRNHDSDEAFVAGPDGISNGAADFDFQPGYRLTLGGNLGDYQFDTSFTQIDSWIGSSTGMFANPIVFDDTFNNPVVVAAPPANMLAVGNALRIAAMDAASMEDLESERLQAGATYVARARADFRDFEINLGTPRDVSLYRFSVGYRHIVLDESNSVAVTGIFDALDTDDAAVFGDATNDPNDGLSGPALLSSGLALVAGAGDGFDAFDTMGGPDTLTIDTSGIAKNELNGAQFTIARRLVDGEWVTIEGIGKAGIYRNNISARVQETIAGSVNDDSVYRRTLSDDRLNAAFAGNIGIRATTSLTDYINMVVGYDVLFLSGVALAADQASGVTTNILGQTSLRARKDGSVIAHGGNLGVRSDLVMLGTSYYVNLGTPGGAIRTKPGPPSLRIRHTTR